MTGFAYQGGESHVFCPVIWYSYELSQELQTQMSTGTKKGTWLQKILPFLLSSTTIKSTTLVWLLLAKPFKGFPSYPVNDNSLQDPYHLYLIISLISHFMYFIQFSSVTQSCPTLCDPMNCSTPVSLSITNSRRLRKLMSIKLRMTSNHLILCHPLLLLHSISPGIRVFSSDSVLCIRWPKYWSFSFSITPQAGRCPICYWRRVEK